MAKTSAPKRAREIYYAHSSPTAPFNKPFMPTQERAFAPVQALSVQDKASAPLVGAGVGAIAGVIVGGASTAAIVGTVLGAGAGYYFANPEYVTHRTRRAIAAIRSNPMVKEWRIYRVGEGRPRSATEADLARMSDSELLERVLNRYDDEQLGYSVRRESDRITILKHGDPIFRAHVAYRDTGTPVRHNPTGQFGATHDEPSSLPIALGVLGIVGVIAYLATKKPATVLMPRPIPDGLTDGSSGTGDAAARDARVRPFALAAQAQLTALGTAVPSTGVFDDATMAALAAWGRADANRLQLIQAATPNQTSKALDLLDREYRRVRNLPAP